MVAKYRLEDQEVAQELSLYDLGRDIQDEGGWEEFHQRRHNYTMYDHYKARRLKLQAEYNQRKAKGEINAGCHC